MWEVVGLGVGGGGVGCERWWCWVWEVVGLGVGGGGVRCGRWWGCPLWVDRASDFIF